MTAELINVPVSLIEVGHMGGGGEGSGVLKKRVIAFFPGGICFISEIIVSTGH
jgi:hypothetical protein